MPPAPQTTGCAAGPDPTGRGGRRTALCDKTGTIMSFEASRAPLCKTACWCCRRAALIDGDASRVRLWHPVRSSTLPPAQRCRYRKVSIANTLCGDKLVFSCYARPEWTGRLRLGYRLTSRTARVVVQEKDGTTVYRAEAASAYRLFSRQRHLSDWVELDVATGEKTTDQILYNTQTGEQYTGILQVCPGGLSQLFHRRWPIRATGHDHRGP